MTKHFHYDISEISFLQNIHFIISDNSKKHDRHFHFDKSELNNLLDMCSLSIHIIH